MSSPVWEGKVDGTDVRLFEESGGYFKMARQQTLGGWVENYGSPGEFVLGQVIQSLLKERAAAPDLLEVLKDLVRQAGGKCDKDDLRRAAEAIKKAGG